MRHLGRSLPRLEAGPLVAGRGWYVGSIEMADQLSMRVVRSPFPHARITSIDVSEALAVPGVVAAWSWADLGDVAPIGFRRDVGDALAPFRQPVLASDMVRYVGEPVAVVFAETAAIAEDAADLVDFRAELLDASIDPADSVFGGSVDRATAAVVEEGFGDVDSAFASADLVVELELEIGRHSAMPLEPRGLVAHWDGARDMLEVCGAARFPHIDRDMLAAQIGRPASRIALIEGHVGGGFGVRGEIGPEDVLVCLAALRFGRPVAWIEDRTEHMIAAAHARGQRHIARIAAQDDGRLVALDVTFMLDQGAYLRPDGLQTAQLTAAMLPGPYRLDAFRAVGDVRLTHKTPAGTYRAGGRYESTFVRERLVDAVADKLGLDPVEVRQRNFLTPDEMPADREVSIAGSPVIYDSGDYTRLLQRTADTIGLARLRKRIATRRAKGERVGLGMSFFVDRAGGGSGDGARITVDDTGTVEVITGAADVGQGVETAVAQIVADILAIPYTDVRVVHGRTDAIGFGQGAHGSRATVMTGTAAQQAAEKVREKALSAAAAMIGVSVDRLMLEDGEVRSIEHAGAPGLPLGAVARALRPDLAPVLDVPHSADTAGLSAEAWVSLDSPTFPYGMHVAVVSVDEATGAVTVERYMVAADVGNPVNPRLIEGQLGGGAAQGIGGALSEEFLFSATGEPLAANLTDYVLPTADRIPDIEFLITDDAPSPLTPLGIKGAGELGTNGAGAAIAAAIDHAIGIPGAVTRLPVTPSRLRAILRGIG
mgnify:CR=1 FL=1